MRSLLAGWRVSLRRTRADWPIVAAAWLITLLAAILLAAGPIYSSAASEAGLRRALADAPVADTNIEVSLYVAPADAGEVDGQVQTELQRVIGPLGGSIVRDWRGSATLALPGLAEGEDDDQAILGFLDGLADHATLVEGDWPADSGGPSEPIQVVVVDATANELRLGVGDELSLVAYYLDPTQAEHVRRTVRARLVGIFAIDSVADPYWNGDDQLIRGIKESGHSRTFGPFLTTPNDLLQHAGVASVHALWRPFPNFERLTVDGTSSLRSRLNALPERLQIATGKVFDVATGLPALLTDAERSLLVSRTSVLLLIAQLAILAAYAIILTASLLVEHRRIDTALLRSRGAGPSQVALFALSEGLLLAMPAVLVAPWLAVAALNLLNVVGPLADVSLHVVPRVTVDGYLAAAAAGVVCVTLLVLPAVLSARAFAAEHGAISRQETRTFGQRMGLDVALLAITGIALWQLRLYGAPLTRTVHGSLGLDPLLVAAPGIGLLAGGVLALRILPLLAQGVETAVSRGRDLVASLGSRQLARRPLRYTRSALLLMLASSMGVFALSYNATWSTSQREQAAYQSGADVRVLPSHSLAGLPAWALPSAYAGLASIEEALPVERIANGVSFGAGSADLLALDADAAAGVVLFRGDESATPLGDLMQSLGAGRPEPHLATLTEGARYLRIVVRLDIVSISHLEYDPITGDGQFRPIDPGWQGEVRVRADAIVRDADGLLYRVGSDPMPMAGPDTPLVMTLQPEGPLELAGLGVDLWLPSDAVMTDAVVEVATVSAGDAPDGSWTEVPLAPTGTWSARLSQGGRFFEPVSAGQIEGTAIRFAGDEPHDYIFGNGPGGLPALISLQPASIASLQDQVPAVANRAFMSAIGSVPGDTISATVAGGVQRLSIIGEVDSFPTTDPERPLLVMDEPTLGLLRLQGTSEVRSADEWWIDATDGQEEALIGALRGSPFESADVVSVVDRLRSLSADPVALGSIGALTLGSVAGALFAIVGLTVSAAVSARQRRTEFALMRAIGLSGRQLAGSLWLENGSLVLVSLIAGTSLGLLIGWVVLPFVTVTQGATAPVPPVLVQIPWDRILLLNGASAIALGVAVVVIGGVLRRLGVGSALRMGED